MEGEHKGRALTRYSRTGSLDRKKRYNINKIEKVRAAAVAKSQAKVSVYACARVVNMYSTTQYEFIILWNVDIMPSNSIDSIYLQTHLW